MSADLQKLKIIGVFIKQHLLVIALIIYVVCFAFNNIHDFKIDDFARVEKKNKFVVLDST